MGNVVSILVFLDDALKVWYWLQLHLQLHRFQSLFFWMTLWKTVWRIPLSEPTGSFNPCFSGWRSERNSYPSSRYSRGVSILVFLDDALKVPHIRWMRLNQEGFNPCFSGWRSESRKIQCRPDHVLMFQSLFFWMTLWKPYRGGRGIDVIGFNPCFSGWRSERLDRSVYDVWTYWFQSLFFWMTLWKRGGAVEEGEGWCFNPCFSGWRSESVQMGKETKTNETVSILVFLDDALKVLPEGVLHLETRVSILVFLDDALKVLPACWTSSIARSFNPCFSGWRSESWAGRHTVHIAIMFQSLFFWMTLWKRLMNR